MREVLDFLNDDLEVDEMMISPAYAYEKAPDQEHFLGVTQTRKLFSEAFADGRRKRWRLNHSPLFLDFLEGKAEFDCTAWGIPSYSLFGWQRPCYLMSDGYAQTYKELLETTDWSAYGRGQGPAVRELHGPLRLRADRRAADHALAQAVATRARRLGRSAAPVGTPGAGLPVDALAATGDGCPARSCPRPSSAGIPRPSAVRTSTACRTIP